MLLLLSACDASLYSPYCYLDADGDGFGAAGSAPVLCGTLGAAAGIGDCDDTDPTRDPGAVDTPNDGYDEDCAGGEGSADYAEGELTAEDADVTWVGGNTGDNLGGQARYVGDVDGDGVDDVWLGALLHDAGIEEDAGAGYLFTGPVAPADLAVSEAAATVVGTDDDDQFGAGGRVGDVDGDGVDDLVVGAHQYAGDWGALFYFPGPISGTTSASGAWTTIEGNPGTQFGGQVVFGGDLVVGDGRADVVTGVTYDDTFAPSAGAVYVFSAETLLAGGVLSAELDHTLRFTGTTSAGHAGRSVCTLSFDGDTVRDIVAGVDGRAPGGAIYVVLESQQSAPLDEAGVELTGAGGNLGAANACPGDLDGDGYEDFLAGGARESDSEGKVYVVRGGPAVASGSIDDSPAVLADIVGGTIHYSYFGNALSSGDWNGDGATDLAIGEYEDAATAGAVHLLLGPFASGTYETSIADLSLVGGEGDRLGARVDLGGDVGGPAGVADGYDDLLIGADLTSEDLEKQGAVHILFGGPW